MWPLEIGSFTSLDEVTLHQGRPWIQPDLCLYKKAMWWQRQRLEWRVYNSRIVTSHHKPGQRPGTDSAAEPSKEPNLPTAGFPTSSLRNHETILLWFWATQFVVLCYTNPRKLIPLAGGSFFEHVCGERVDWWSVHISRQNYFYFYCYYWPFLSHSLCSVPDVHDTM